MENLLILSENKLKQDGLSQTLAITSLQCLKEVLNQEAYEQCAEILKIAQEYGVESEAIQKVISQHIAYLTLRDRKLTFRALRP